MRKITLNLADNPRGADPLTGLYAAIQRSWSNLGLTQANSTIAKIQHFSSVYEPDRTIVVIRRNAAPHAEFSFYYDRFKITRYITNPMWTELELAQVKLLGSQELLQRIGQKLNLNLTDDDFFVEEAGIKYTGGQTRPNWLLKARFDSIYWYGEKVIWLHNGTVEPEPEPEPTGLRAQLFPAQSSVYNEGEEWEIDIRTILGKTLLLESAEVVEVPTLILRYGDKAPIVGSEFRVLVSIPNTVNLDVFSLGMRMPGNNSSVNKIAIYGGSMLRFIVKEHDEDGNPVWFIVGYYDISGGGV